MPRRPTAVRGLAVLAALLLLAALLASVASAFLLPVPGPGRSGGLTRIGTTGSSGSRRGAVVAMAKGRKSEKKRKSSSSSNKPPQPASEEAGAAEGSTGTSTSSGSDDAEAGTFSILGSAGDGPAAGKGFGAKPVRPAPTAKDVDAAYERALSKIKGQDTLSSTPLGGGGAMGGPPAGEPGKVPVRNVDIFDLMPESLQTGIETTLIALLAANLLVIILLGIGFSVEALPTSNLDLPAALVSASKAVKPLVEQYEFLFTPALGTFFLVSTLLGSFKIAQLGKGGTTYREK